MPPYFLPIVVQEKGEASGVPTAGKVSVCPGKEGMKVLPRGGEEKEGGPRSSCFLDLSSEGRQRKRRKKFPYLLSTISSCRSRSKRSDRGSATFSTQPGEKKEKKGGASPFSCALPRSRLSGPVRKEEEGGSARPSSPRVERGRRGKKEGSRLPLPS